MHGLGNDFMVLDTVSEPLDIPPERIKELADRHFGIGFDQLLRIEPPTLPDVDFDYRIFNADGSEVQHCGNGARCFAQFVLDRGLISKPPIRVNAPEGILELDIDAQGNVCVDMGTPDFRPSALPFLAEQQKLEYQLIIDSWKRGNTLKFGAVSMGNPHAVMQVANVEQAQVEKIGPLVTKHPIFPEGVNVGFMEVVNRNTIRLRVYERGVGETLACGTGACAAVAIGRARGSLDDIVTVKLTGGDLTIRWLDNQDSMTMSGPTCTVYEGRFNL